MSIFQDEWRDCLREQYKSVIRGNDQVTLNSLLPVLHRVGFTDSELAELKVEATIRAEDLPDDFVPDLDVLKHTEQPSEVDQAFQPHPLECQCPACVEKNLAPHDADGQPIPLDQLDPENPEHQKYLQRLAALDADDNEDDEDNPAQLSLF